MALLRVPALLEWVKGRTISTPQVVGVLNAGNIPLVALQDWLAVVLTGAGYRGVLSSRSPFFLPAFALEVFDRYPHLDIDFVAFEDLFDEISALIASGSDETMSIVQALCLEHGLDEQRQLLRGNRYSMAVLTGNESATEKECLAEDVLLHEGMGCRNAAILWAPEGLSPDSYLDAFAVFRSVFPPHERTPGALKMKQAFLDAIGASHAYSDGLEFLVSKGEPEQQEPGHIRWAEYRTQEELVSWIRDHEGELQLIIAGRQGIKGLEGTVPVLPFGEAQRPSLDWCADNTDTIAFLHAL